MWGTAIGALGVLVALATIIGVATDRQARDAAWRRIADSRRINQKNARTNDDLWAELALWQEELEARERRIARREKGPEDGSEDLPTSA